MEARKPIDRSKPHLINKGSRRVAFGPPSRHVWDKKLGRHVPRENYDGRILKLDTPADDGAEEKGVRDWREHNISPEMAKRLNASPLFQATKDEFGLELVG